MATTASKAESPMRSAETNAPARDAPADPSLRRAAFARDEIERIIKQKLGNPLAFGQTTIRLRWQKGQLELVTTIDEADYK